MAAQAPLTTLAMASSDDKNRIDHIDKAEDVVDDTAKAAPPAEGMLRKSHFDGMTRWRTIYVFRQSVFYTFLVYIGYMAEGFEVGPGRAESKNEGARADMLSSTAVTRSWPTGALSSNSARSP